MNLGAAGPLGRGLVEFGDLVELTFGRDLVGTAKYDAEEEQRRKGKASPPQTRNVRSVQEVGVVDVVNPVAAQILLGDEAVGSEPFRGIRVGRRE